MWDVQLLSHPRTEPANLVPAKADANIPVPTFVLYPAGKHKLAKTFEWGSAEWAKIKAGGFALYAYGRTEYIDAFGERQWAEFCAFLDADSIGQDFQEAVNAVAQSRGAVPAAFKFTRFNFPAQWDPKLGIHVT